MNFQNNVLLGYDDVTLIPKYSEIMSRSDPDTSVSLHGLSLKTPIISANMDTITESKMAIAMFQAGGIGALHRFMSIDDNVENYKQVKAAGCECFVTVGVKDYVDRSAALYDAGARYFIIDIAHGHSLLMKNALVFMRQKYKDMTIMAGNIATGQATRDLLEWGADIIKVGVSAGSICKTRVVTGHGVPMFSSILECAHELDGFLGRDRGRGKYLIADGGIKSSGDVMKAFVAGADAVMIGSLLSGTDETPGNVVYPMSGLPSKQYRGMASSEAQGDRGWGSNGLTTAPEGVSALVPCKGPVNNILKETTMGLKSGMSYCNSENLYQIPLKAEWRQQTLSGYYEGIPHILGKK